MDQIWPSALGAGLANLLTLAFLYGLWRVRQIRDERKIDGLTSALLIIPLLFLAGGVWLYT